MWAEGYRYSQGSLLSRTGEGNVLMIAAATCKVDPEHLAFCRLLMSGHVVLPSM